MKMHTNIRYFGLSLTLATLLFSFSSCGPGDSGGLEVNEVVFEDSPTLNPEGGSGFGSPSAGLVYRFQGDPIREGSTPSLFEITSGIVEFRIDSASGNGVSITGNGTLSFSGDELSNLPYIYQNGSIDIEVDQSSGISDIPNLSRGVSGALEPFPELGDPDFSEALHLLNENDLPQIITQQVGATNSLTSSRVGILRGLNLSDQGVAYFADEIVVAGLLASEASIIESSNFSFGENISNSNFRNDAVEIFTDF